MSRTSKLEQVLELLLNEDNERAEELLHEYVVETARAEYERILDEADEDEFNMGGSVKDDIVELFHKFYDFGDEGLDRLDSIDLYRELSDRYSLDIEELVAQADPSELESLKMEMEAVLDELQGMMESDSGDPAGDFEDDIVDDEEDMDDMDMDDEDMEADDTEERIDDLEAALEELQKEFEELMSDEESDEEMDDMDMDDEDMDDDEEMEEEYDLAEDFDFIDEDDAIEEATNFSKKTADQPMTGKKLKGSEADNEQSPFTKAPKQPGVKHGTPVKSMDGSDGKRDGLEKTKAKDHTPEDNIDVNTKAVKNKDAY